MGPRQKFRSFNKDDSPDLDDKLKNWVTTRLTKNFFGPPLDSLILINSKDHLQA